MPAVNTARERAEQDPVIWLIGLAAGFAAAFPGLGGGLVLVPALFLLLRRPIKQAIGTSLAVVLFVSLAAILADWEVGGVRIRWTWALLLAAGSLLGSVIGGRLIGRIADSPLRLALAGVLVVSSIPAFTGSLVGSPGPKGSLGSLIAAPPLLGYLVILAAGLGAGIISVLIGVGAGLVTIPALALLVGDLPLDAMRGTSLPAILVAAGIGAREHARFGHLERRLAEALVPAGLAGAVLGVVAMAHLPVRICEVGLAALLVVAAIRLLAQVFHPSALSRWGSQFGRRGRQPDANAR
jgi:hypothetical protein